MKAGIFTSEFWVVIIAWGFSIAVNRGWLPAGDYKDIVGALSTIVASALSAYYMKGRVDLKKNGGTSTPPEGSSK